MNSLRRNIKRFVWFVLILIFIIGIAITAILYFYGDDVKQSIISQLNEELNTEISVEDVQLNLIKNFPKASIRFKNVASGERGISGKSKLVKAGEIAIMFDLSDIFKGNYTIKKIYLKDAFLNLEVKTDGSVNYQIFNNNGRGDNKTTISLQKADFKNVVISYIHAPSKQEYLFRIDKGSLEGVFSSSNQKFEFDGSVFSTHIKSGENTFLKDRLLLIRTAIELDKNSNIILFQEGRIEASDVVLEFAGNVKNETSTKQLDLNMRVTKTDLKSLIEFIPDQYLQAVADYKLEGKVGINVIITGKFSGNSIPQIDSEFTMENGRFLLKNNDFELNKVSFSGHFSNGKYRSEKSYSLLLKNIKSNFKNGVFQGEIKVRDFVKPILSTRIVASLDMEDLIPVISIDTLKNLDGKLDLELEFSNRLQNFRKFTANDFISSKTTGSLKVRNMNLKLKNSTHNFKDFNGDFKFDNKDLRIDQFSGMVSSTDFEMTGYFRNILAYAFIPSEPIYIYADFKSADFNLDEILEKGNQESDQKSVLRFSRRVNFDLNFLIDRFTFRKFESLNNSGKIIQKNRILHVENAQLKSMDGSVKISGSVNGQRDDIYFIDCDATFNEVDISKLFRDFGNFRQDNLVSENLKGKVNAEVQYTSTLSPVLYVDPKSVVTRADIEIFNGELIAYKPLHKLSKYIKSEDFEHVHFSNIKNEIEIRDEVIYIPKMDIESSSMNLSLFGNHKFNNEIDYHIELLLADIIARKDVIEEDLGDNFVEDDGLGRTKLFLRMTGQ